MKSEKIPGWDPELEGKLAGERERAMRHQSGRLDKLVKQRSYCEHMGAKAEREGREPLGESDENESLIEPHRKVGQLIADRFVLEVKK